MAVTPSLIYKYIGRGKEKHHHRTGHTISIYNSQVVLKKQLIAHNNVCHKPNVSTRKPARPFFAIKHPHHPNHHNSTQSHSTFHHTSSGVVCTLSINRNPTIQPPPRLCRRRRWSCCRRWSHVIVSMIMGRGWARI